MDSMDFVKRAWATLDLSSPFTPTLSLEEMDKRIADLRAVEQWLALNQGMLRNTIQGLEIQRGTLAAVQSLSESFGRMTWPAGEQPEAATAGPAASPAPARAATSPAPAAQPVGTADRGSAPPPLPAWGSGMDPLAWWTALQGNFEQIARMASAQPGADPPRAPDADPPAGRDKPSAKPAAKARSPGKTGTKPAPRRTDRQATRGDRKVAGAAGDAGSPEER